MPLRSRRRLEALLPASSSAPIDPTLAVTDVSQDSVSAAVPKAIGRYLVASLLGSGGYGRVFKAFDEKLQRHVAIKLPHRYRITSEESLETYIDEARTLAKLDHPGIVTVHDVGVTEDGVPYIVSAYIDGTSLGLRMQSEPFTLRAGLELIADIGRTLAYVHAQGVVHRDVKPENILLSRDGKPFLADFGLASRDETAVSFLKRVFWRRFRHQHDPRCQHVGTLRSADRSDSPRSSFLRSTRRRFLLPTASRSA